MNKFLKATVFTSLVILSACIGTNCNHLPTEYSSYEEAIKIIKAAHFKLEESINTSKSSWIRGAYFYSCDGITGFFILEMDKKDYIYSGMPIEIWEDFKFAKSYGSYYNMYIKHKYQFYLKN